MVISAVVAAVGVAAEVSGAAAIIGGAIGGAIGLDAAAVVIGSTTVADVIGGGVIGMGLGGLKSAATGGNFFEGALVGAVTGGVGSVVSGAIGSQFGAGIDPLTGVKYGPEIAGSGMLGQGVTKGLTGVVTGGLGGALAGGDPLRGALLGGASGLVGGLTGSSLLGGATSALLGQAFAPDAPAKQATQPTGPTVGATYTPTITAKSPSTTVSTAPLGGALLASPTLGYTPGSTFLGGSDKDKPAQNVWNQASLKEGAPVGPSTSDGTSQS